jgi:DNA-binding NarL/FixJ family response regulator
VVCTARLSRPTRVGAGQASAGSGADADDLRDGPVRGGVAAGRSKRFPAQDGAAGRTRDADRHGARGEALLAPAILRRLLTEWTARWQPDEQDPWFGRLTHREREVLRLVGRDLSNAELSAHLHLAEPTMKTHVSRILATTGSRDRVQAVVLAYETGLVRRGE